MPVDSFRFLPRIIAFYYQQTDRRPELPIPWTPLYKSLQECKFGLVTSAGFYHRGVDPPFDLERERHEKIWGDPTYRVIPMGIPPEEIGVSHLHIDTRDVLEDPNILLPMDRFRELLGAGEIGGIAGHAYAFMGYQGFPPDTSGWVNEYGPQVAERLLADEVDCVFLTPA